MLREELKYITIDYLRDDRKISVRAANCCIDFGLISVDEVLNCFEENKSFFNVKIRNAGQRTCFELDNLCKFYLAQIKNGENSYCRNEGILNILQGLTVQQREILLIIAKLTTESGELLKQKERQYGLLCSENFLLDFYDKYCHLPMLWILEQNLKRDKSREIEILLDSYNIIEKRHRYDLDELALRYGLTHERVRQIRQNVFHRTFDITDTIIDYKKNNLDKYNLILNNKDDWSYLLDDLNHTDIVCKDSFEITRHIQEEACTFSVEFVLQILAYLLRDKFSLFGGIDISKKNKVWDNTYLIKKEYTDIFDFLKMRELFCNMVRDNETDNFLNLEEHIANSSCWLNYDYSKTEAIINIIKVIILLEFHLYPDSIDGCIIIPANKERNPIDLVYEILRQNGRPMHLDEIFDKFKNILPEHKYSEPAQLRPYLRKHTAIAFRNRNSVYTLKEWNHIKTGTIRDAVVEYLSEKDSPQTAENITEYVLKHFPETNLSSVKTSILNDSRKRFSYYDGARFGLKSSKYSQEYALIEKPEGCRRNFEKQLHDLELFIVEKEHFPFTSSKNKEEASLGRWWLRIINNNQRITEAQKAEVNRVLNNYREYATCKKTYEWDLNCNNLKLFLLENRRMPSTHVDESFLYKWFRSAQRDFENYRLTEKQRQKYIDLAKLT